MACRTVATKKVKQELDNQYQKVLIRPANSPGREVSSRKEEEMISCDRSAHIMARRETLGELGNWAGELPQCSTGGLMACEHPKD
ncbi:unnamed protein product [Cladocopium goreaui]|uniref:Uncharacterized protein n=1 Tax=Cladocopium goreaui TaxID=2562237 RepID=A0A9P1BQB6_9DINO|nr:unnamed protein product [Cladocopium goreaui]